MKKHDILLRAATPEDAEAMRGIYAPYVENTAVSFEYAVPSPGEFRGRVERTLEKYPWIAALEDGEIVGYAYAGAFHPRPAYGWNAESTVYIREDRRRSGLGQRLYGALEALCAEQHILTIDACIALPRGDDPWLTGDSAAFHARMGYRRVGEFPCCGYKFGRWYDMVWMEKELLAHTAAPAPVIPFPELSREALERAGLSVV